MQANYLANVRAQMRLQSISDCTARFLCIRSVPHNPYRSVRELYGSSSKHPEPLTSYIYIYIHYYESLTGL